MSDGTAIQWTDASWNPVTGCTKVSPGYHADAVYWLKRAESEASTPSLFDLVPTEEAS